MVLQILTMKIFLTLILFLTSYLIKAQGQTDLDSIDVVEAKKFQLYVAPGYSLVQFAQNKASFAEIHLGIAYDKMIEVDVFYSAILDSYIKQIIFPSSHKYGQKNVGINAQYYFTKSDLRPLLGVGYQFTEASWIPEGDSDESYNDHLNMIKLYLGASWSISQSFALQVDASYRFANGVDLVGIEPDDYDGFGINLMLKVRLLKW